MSKFGADDSNARQTPWGEFAWRAEDIPEVMLAVRRTNSVILGGDVITPAFEYTGDNWFYDPTWLLNAKLETSLQDNTDRSVECAAEYIRQYTGRNGKDYLFTLAVCTGVEALLHAEKRTNQLFIQKGQYNLRFFA